MTQDTLTVLHQHATYLDGYLFVNVITNEECVLDLLITATKPTSKRNPDIQEPGMQVHRWLFTMRDVRRIADLVTTPNTVHNYSFRFPELSDILYFTVLYKDLPDTTSPQAPIFAWRIPLRPIYTQLWTTDPPYPEWAFFETRPTAEINVTPGRMTFRMLANVVTDARAILFPPPNADPSTLLKAGIFILWDAAYVPFNTNPDSFYIVFIHWRNPGFTAFRQTFTYGDINVDPCAGFASGFLNNFNPHEPRLFCGDLYRLPPTDICGNPLDTAPDMYLEYIDIFARNRADPSTNVPGFINDRPFALFQMTGPLQDISNRWRYVRPLLPQGSSPRFEPQQ